MIFYHIFYDLSSISVRPPKRKEDFLLFELFAEKLKRSGEIREIYIKLENTAYLVNFNNENYIIVFNSEGKCKLITKE